MKSLIIFAVVVSVASVQSAMSEEEMKKMFMATAMDCKAKEGVSDDDFNSMMATKAPPKNKEEKCLIACVLEKEGIVSLLKIEPSEFF